MQNHSIGVVWFDLETFVVYFWLRLFQQFLKLSGSSFVHVDICLAVLYDRKNPELFDFQVFDEEKLDFSCL